MSVQQKVSNALTNLGNLFSMQKSNYVVDSQHQNIVNPDAIRVGETYTQWGTRICGIVSGCLMSLQPQLHKVYNYAYNEQAENVEYQETARKNTQAKIDQANEEIQIINRRIADARSNIDEINRKTDELKAEKQRIINAEAKIAKEQRLKLIIGLVILIPLTFYLFLFYSSTFYSAFYRNPGDMTTAMNAMFDGNALENASANGITELGFVLLAPIIFLGLGFVLHFFSVQKGIEKYLKMGAIVFVTAMFDCILAYKIGEQIHTLGVIIGTHPIGEEYTVKMAVYDINTWAVIFCGFIAYIIWGLVFGMCMSAYDKLDLNRTQLESIEAEKKNLEQRVNAERDNIRNWEQREIELRNGIREQMAKLGNEVYIDYADIRTKMNDYFAGWIKQMQILSLGAQEQKDATDIYNNTISVLIK